MVMNSRIILDTVLEQQHQAVDPESDQGGFFEFFTAQQTLKDFDLSYEEIGSGMVGDGGDGGVDSIYLLVNGDLVQEDSEYSNVKKAILIDLIVIQSKRNTSFEETPVERFITISHDIFNLAPDKVLKGVYNNRLVDAISRFQKLYQDLAPWFPTLRVRFIYASRGDQVHNNVRRKVEILQEAVQGLLPHSEFSFDFLGATELLGLARQRPHETHQLKLAESPISSGSQVGFVCLVKLRDFFEFITDDQGSIQRHLFEANVRDYQGRNQVNDEIRTSLGTRRSEDFWWLNNGVSIVADQASQAGKTLTIKDPQIVNGLQTSSEIYDYYKGISADDDDRNILIRVMVPVEPGSRDRIIKATNSQTTVPLASLRATDKIHRDIEEYFQPRGLFYDRRKNYYKNQGKPRKAIVNIPELAQAVMAIALRQPDQARARPSTLLKNEEQYGLLFDESYSLQVYYVCAEALRRVERFLRSPSLGVPPRHRNNLRFYVAMQAVVGVGKMPTPALTRIENFDLDSLDETAVQHGVDFVQPHYLSLGGNDQVAKGTTLLSHLLGDVSTP